MAHNSFSSTDASVILMLEKDWVSKETIATMLGMTERAVRDYIAGLNLRLAPYGKCILSTASHKGYKIPNAHNDEDVAIVIHAVDELKSKAISIFERRKVLEDFIKTSQTIRAEEKHVQMSLFES